MINNYLNKILSINDLEEKILKARLEGKTIVFANGCFDLLHVGHVRYLYGAKALGDLLLVAINSDRIVRQLKGSNRPLTSENERAEIITALSCVDYVTIFDTPTVTELLLLLKPDIHAKGTDYTTETVPEREIVKSYGGRVAIVGDPKDHSTTSILEQIIQ
ncbi:MAG: adenylyltransferase/cytidyltransferase family protein [Blastocatellia bacterium]